MKKIQSIIILSAFGMLACTETNTVINPGEKPIVQAYLASGSPVKMTVFKEIPYSNENSEGKSESIKGLSIKIKDNAGKEFMLIDKGNGTYESDKKDVVGKAGTQYSFEFNYLSRTISATTIIPTKPVNYKLNKIEVKRNKIDLSGGFGGGFPNFGAEDNTAIEATWQNPDKAYYFMAVIASDSNPESIITLPSDVERPNIRFTNSPVSGDATNIQPRSFQYFGKHKAILFRVNEDYAALYQSSGTSTQNLSTPPSSITNGLGIFTGINADTLTITVKKQ